MRGLGIGLLVAAYLLAVIDGVREDIRLFPVADDDHRRGWKRELQDHPWIVAGAVAGIAGTIITSLAP